MEGWWAPAVVRTYVPGHLAHHARLGARAVLLLGLPRDQQDTGNEEGD